MLNYVNTFACAFDKENGMIVLELKQNAPVFPESNNDSKGLTTKTESVSSVILDSQTARELCNAIFSLLPAVNDRKNPSDTQD